MSGAAAGGMAIQAITDIGNFILTADQNRKMWHLGRDQFEWQRDQWEEQKKLAQDMIAGQQTAAVTDAATSRAAALAATAKADSDTAQANRMAQEKMNEAWNGVALAQSRLASTQDQNRQLVAGFAKEDANGNESETELPEWLIPAVAIGAILILKN